MIEALATPIGNFIRLEISHPDNKQVVFKNVPNAGEGLRVIYFMNRDYMVQKLTSWCSQRMYSKDKNVLLEAARLKGLLLYHKDISFPKLCQIVTKHRHFFEGIAPKHNNTFYRYYINRIVPILDDAGEMAGDHA